MLDLTGKCCDAITAVEFFESLAEIIPEDNRTDDFCDEYEQALNRFRYEAAKDIGAKKRIVKAAYKHQECMMWKNHCQPSSEMENIIYVNRIWYRPDSQRIGARMFAIHLLPL